MYTDLDASKFSATKSRYFFYLPKYCDMHRDALESCNIYAYNEDQTADTQLKLISPFRSRR